MITLFSLTLVALFFTLLVVVLYRVLVSSRTTAGLLATTLDGSIDRSVCRHFDRNSGVATYGTLGFQEIFRSSTRLPDVPNELLSIIAGSQLLFLGSKAFRQPRQSK